jgi:hypothetical protein
MQNGSKCAKCGQTGSIDISRSEEASEQHEGDRNEVEGRRDKAQKVILATDMTFVSVAKTAQGNEKEERKKAGKENPSRKREKVNGGNAQPQGRQIGMIGSPGNQIAYRQERRYEQSPGETSNLYQHPLQRGKNPFHSSFIFPSLQPF